MPSVRRPDSGGQAGKQPAARLCLSGRRTDGRWPGWGSFAELENPGFPGPPSPLPRRPRLEVDTDVLEVVTTEDGDVAKVRP